MRAAILTLGLVGGGIALGLGVVGSLFAPRTTSMQFYGAVIVGLASIAGGIVAGRRAVIGGGLLAFAACGLLWMFRDDPAVAAVFAAPAAVGALLALNPVGRRP